jgi:hypothetical protein
MSKLCVCGGEEELDAQFILKYMLPYPHPQGSLSLST